MPIKKSSAKHARQTKKRTKRNLIKKQAIKKTVKAALRAAGAGEKNLKNILQDAQQALDKAAKTGVIKRKTAARKLSRLMKKVNALQQTKQTAP